VVAEARWAIVTFGIVGVWSLILGAWMAGRAESIHTLDLTLPPASHAAFLSNNGGGVDVGFCSAPLVIWRGSGCQRVLHSVWVSVSLHALGLILASLSGPLFEITYVEFGTSVTSRKTLLDVIGYVLHDTTYPAPAVCVALIISFLTVAVPLLVASAMVVASIGSLAAPSSVVTISAIRLANGLALWSTLDVFAIGTFITIIEYEELVAAILAAAMGIPAHNLPLHFPAKAGWGCWLMLPSSACLYIAALLSTSVAKAHPLMSPVGNPAGNRVIA